MDVKEIEVYSNKYDIKGRIIDAGFVVKLIFEYAGRTVTMGLDRSVSHKGTYQEEGEQLIDSYIDNLYSEQDNEIKVYNWYFEDLHTFLRLRGVVTGHSEFNDGTAIYLFVKSYEVDFNRDEVRVYLEDVVYHCPLMYMNFRKQNKRDPEHSIFPEFEEIEKRYKGKKPVYDIEPGKVLLVLSNHDEYYFNTLYCKPDEESEEKDYTAFPHTGNYQDSYLIMSYDNSIDIRFFPHFQYIEFYMQDTGGWPLYIENSGSTILYCMTEEGLIRLEPHARKLVCTENVEKQMIKLPGGDLYPAGIADKSDWRENI